MKSPNALSKMPHATLISTTPHLLHTAYTTSPSKGGNIGCSAYTGPLHSSPSNSNRFWMGCSLWPNTLITSCANWPPKNAVTGANSLPRFCKKLRRNSERRVSGGSCKSLCFSVANVVNNSKSACECDGKVLEIDWNSQSALKQVRSGEICILRRREERSEAGTGELFARIMGEYISRLVTISTSLPLSPFFVEEAMIERVAVSGFKTVGMFDFSRSMTKSWVIRSANI